MFPNIRLMVVAILAAIAGISCGLGLFATFRVNHEPLVRLAEGSPPLPLGLDNLALGLEARVPSQARLPVDAIAKVVAVPAMVAPPNLAPDHAAADSANAEHSSLQQAAVQTGAEDQSNATSVAVPPEQSGAAAEAVAPSQQETVAAPQDQQPAAAAVRASPAEQVAAVNAAAADQQSASKSAEGKAAKPAARATRAVPARHAAKTARARRTVVTATAQPAFQYTQPTYANAQPTYSQPTSTWLYGAAQASQPVKRAVINRHRTAKKRPAERTVQSLSRNSGPERNPMTGNPGLTLAAPAR